MKKINRARGIRDFSRNSVLEAEMWRSIKWLLTNARFQPSDVTYFESVVNFNPEVCHRKLYLVSKNKRKYIFSPIADSSNKFTPIHEIINYQLGRILCPPGNIYLPHTEGIILDQDDYHLGYGSLKEFISITKTNVWTGMLSPEINAWVQLYDYLIVNVERDWNDHICMDELGRICLLDNDMGLYHLDEHNNYNFSQLDELDDDTTSILYNLQKNKSIIYEIEAPYHWYEIIFGRINKVLTYLQNS